MTTTEPHYGVYGPFSSDEVRRYRSDEGFRTRCDLVRRIAIESGASVEAADVLSVHAVWALDAQWTRETSER